MSSNMRDAIKKSAEGFPLLGYCVYWSIRDFNQKGSDIQDAMAELGIDGSVFSETQAKTAVNRAVRLVTKGVKDQFSRKVLDEEGVAAFAVVQSAVDGAAMDVSFATQTKAILDKNNGNLKVEGAQAQEIQDAYQGFRDAFSTDQFRALALRYLDRYCDAIKVREGGGVYFVPATKDADFQRLVRLFEKFSETCSLDMIPVIDTQQARKSMWKAMTADVRAEIDSLKKDLTDHQEDGLRDYAIMSRITKYQKLKVQVENYEMVLEGTAADLKAELDEITKKVKTLVMD